MVEFTHSDDTRQVVKYKLHQYFDGKIVRKDLTKHIKEGANVLVYVLEFLLGQYCSSDDGEVIEDGVNTVKRILADNYVRPDEAQKILSQLRKKGSHTIIDMVTVHLDIKKDCFFAEFSNLGFSNVLITDDYPEKYDRMLCGGIWCIVQLEYETEGDSDFGLTDINGNPIASKQKKQKDISPISIPILVEEEEAVARLIESQGIKAVILSEQANQGKTIIDKFEENSDVGAAIALFTNDDVGRAKSTETDSPRARQNVIFEAGYFMGKLGRNRVVLIAEKGIELPSDLQGVVYTDDSDWKLDVCRELKAMNFPIDFNKLF